MTTIKESPRRVQRRRTKGWRMPENTVYVGRGSKWGNPYPVGSMHPSGDGETWVVLSAKNSVSMYRSHLEEGLWGRPSLASQVSELAGKNLACWCRLDQPCHAEALVEIANTKEWMTAGREVLYWPGVRSEHYPPKNGTVLQDGVAIFGGTACVRIRKQDGGTDFIQLSHIEPQL